MKGLGAVASHLHREGTLQDKNHLLAHVRPRRFAAKPRRNQTLTCFDANPRCGRQLPRQLRRIIRVDAQPWSFVLADDTHQGFISLCQQLGRGRIQRSSDPVQRSLS